MGSHGDVSGQVYPVSAMGAVKNVKRTRKVFSFSLGAG